MSPDANTAPEAGRGNEEPARRRILVPALVGILILLGFLIAGWYFTSPRFQQLVRARVIAQLQRSTGGRVELGSFQWNLAQLQFEAGNLTIHGREGPGEAPFFHADRVLVRMRIVSVLSERVALSYVGVERPVIHLVTYADGSTNQPQPSVTPPTLADNVQQLFRLAVQRLEVRQGELQFNHRSLPLDLTADDVVASMDYFLNPRHYQGRVSVGKLDTRLQGMRPFASTAEAEFTLWPTSAQVSSLSWRSGKSHVAASGHVDDFRRPTITAAYQGSVDLAELGAVMRRQELRGGAAEVQGHATYELGTYQANGHVNAADVTLAAASGALRHASVSGDYSLSNDRFALSGLSGRALGGKLSGDLEIVSSVEPTMRASQSHHLPPAPRQQHGVAHLRVEGVSLAEAAQSVSWRSVPFSRLHLAGTASGSVQASWRGSPQNAEAQMFFTVLPPLREQPGTVPLTGHLQATYSGSRHLLTVSRLEVASPAGAVTANGVLGSSSANLSLNLVTSNVRELQPILAVFQGPRRIPVIVHGKATFNGNMAGRISAPTLSGHLQVTDFDSEIRPFLQSRQLSNRPRMMHWDLLSAELQLSPSTLVLHRGVLRRGPAELDFDGNIGLKRYRVTSASPLSAGLRLQRGELADLEGLTGYSYPLSGEVDATLHAEGTWQSPQGQGTIQINHPAYGAIRFTSLRTDISFAAGQADLQNLFLAQGAARVTGTAGYNFGTAQFHFNLQGSHFDLAKFSSLQAGRLQVAGQMDFALQGSGTRQAPTVEGSLQLRHLVFDSEPEGDFTLTATTRGGSTHLAGRSQFTDASLDFDGDLKLQGNFPAQLTLRFSRLDLDPLLQAYMRGRLTGHSSSAGTITISGPLLRPRDLEVRGNVAEFRADIENLKIQNSAPLQFVFLQRTLTLQ
ncbi:MAG TPA: hypothetical protein VLC12_07430, partial [Terriglobales bacterium]|nr:hypothetical protein [Terriglobales bacterium]